ncbi:MAG: NYN domain-containing protein [Myxococcales bacterium]|nr:NYN domain-containing protein [Myxococcales bacterium]MCB9715078.1 NYN domain-containing protein [Myxococcales bacterium]
MSDRIPSTRRTSYVFVDAGHLDPCIRELDGLYDQPHEVDYQLLREHEEAERVFVYDALPIAPTPSQNEVQFQQQFERAKKRLDRIGSIPYVHVRPGSMVGEGKRRRQKEVDISLAVDALTHAFRRNMDHAIVITSDRDFRPLLKALVDAGTYVTLIGRSPPEELRRAADVFLPLEPGRLTAYCYPHAAKRTNGAIVHIMERYEHNSTVKGFGQAGGVRVALRLVHQGTPRRWLVAPADGGPGYASMRPTVAARALEFNLRDKIEWDDDVLAAVSELRPTAAEEP